jgi:hypothetical protein
MAPQCKQRRFNLYINLMCICSRQYTFGDHRTYVVYSMDLSNLLFFYGMDPSNLNRLHYGYI